MKRLLIPLLIVMALGGGMADTLYLDEIYPSRIEGGEGGVFYLVYDLSKYQAPNWLPYWMKEDYGGEGGKPTAEEIQAYVTRLPDELRVKVDMTPATFYVDTTEEYLDEETKLEPSFAPFAGDDNLPSVDMLLWRGKFSDDGLMAAFEYYDEYARPGLTRSAMYERLAQAALNHINDGGNAGAGARALAAKYYAAMQLAGSKPPTQVTADADLRKRVDAEVASIKSDEARWKPISFYTWTPQLSYIYIRDRILCEPFVQDGAQAALVLAGILAADPELGQAYQAERTRRDELTGKPNRDFLTMFTQACSNDSPFAVLEDDARFNAIVAQVQSQLDPDEDIKVVLLPAASTPETRFMATLMPDQLADFMNLFMAAIRDGSVDLAPGATGAWYLFQQHALEPLLTLDKTPEGKKLSVSDVYQERLDEAFQALYAAHRETHAKNAEMGGVGAAAPFYEYVNKIRLFVQPVNNLEPLPEVYRLTSLAYERLAGILALRYDGGSQLRGYRPKGEQVELVASSEVKKLASLYHGFYLLACDDLGIVPDAVSVGDNALRQQARAFLKEPVADGELRQDARFLLPVGRGGEPGKPTTYYWAIGGILERRITFSFNEYPVLDLGKGNDDVYEVGYESSTRRIGAAQFYDFELAGTKSLNRDEFRAIVERAGRNPGKLEEELEKWSNSK